MAGDRDNRDDAVVSPARQLDIFERLLAIQDTSLAAGLTRAADLVASALGADKTDALLLDRASDTLVAVGTSRTPMGRRQHGIGMDRLPLANGGREVEVFLTGSPFLTGHADEDPGQLLGFTQGLGIRSSAVVPLDVAGERRGVLIASSARPDLFTEDDLRLLAAVSRWVGIVAHRAELLERAAAEAREQGRRQAADELIAVLAHDLRNRIVPFKTRVDLIRRRARREGRERDLRDADEAASALDHFGRLITDLLDASRLDQGLFQLDVRPVDLAALVRETAAAFATPTNGIEVWTPDELVASIDPDRLRQAIENLLANAIKHSPPGQVVTVRVELEPGDDRRWIVVVVADKGPGIAPELLPRLFDRFSRGPDSAGLGLGLHLAGGIAEAHGGTLTVDSAPGAGARFRLALPDDRAVAEQGMVARAAGMLDGGEPGVEPIDAVGIGANELE